MSSPLNLQLYNALSRHFGDVKIANQGEPFVSSGEPGKPESSGEYYRVNCPYCNDTRHRLWINHMFNVRESDHDDHLHLCCCYNENCITTRICQLHLLDLIYPWGYRRCQTRSQLTRPEAAPDEHAEAESQIVTFPVSVPLNDPSAIDAAQYLTDRSFDINELSERWDVRYCSACPTSRPAIQERIVIPVYSLKKNIFTQEIEVQEAGWQARTINPNDSACKYLFMKGLKKTRLLYGIQRAVHTQGPLIIVEGPTDVWRLGTHAVATFGKNISSNQVALLTQYFCNRPVIVIYDQDARLDSGKAVNQIRAARYKYNDRAPVIELSPPQEVNDVGDCPRESIWGWIRASRPDLFSSEVPPQNTVHGCSITGSCLVSNAVIQGNQPGSWEIEI